MFLDFGILEILGGRIRIFENLPVNKDKRKNGKKELKKSKQQKNKKERKKKKRKNAS